MISISREEVPTLTGKKLYDLLIKIWDDPEFVRGTLEELKGDEKKQRLIDFIEQYNIDDSDDVIELSMDIADGVIPEITVVEE